MQDARKLFAMNLRRLLERPKYSGANLARYIKRPQSMVSRWLEGEILPTTHLEGIATYLKVGIAELFREPDDESQVREVVREPTIEEALSIVAKSHGFIVRKAKSED